MADVRRDEEPVGVGIDEHRLEAVRGRAPDREPPVAVVVAQHHRKRPLAADEERRRAVAQALAHLGQPETDLPDPHEDLRVRHRADSLRFQLLTGGCLCGGVRYEVDQPPVAAEYCHCTRCQRRTGSAAAVSASARRPARFASRRGRGADLASWDPPDSWKDVFCSACGGALWAQSAADPAIVAVRMGTFDGDPGVRPLVPPVHGLRGRLGADPGRPAPPATPAPPRAHAPLDP